MVIVDPDSSTLSARDFPGVVSYKLVQLLRSRSLTTVHMCLVLTAILQGRPCEGGIITQLIRENVAGPAENFKTTSWRFDPELADRNRVEFERVNGRHGLRLIERIGLGEDGYPEYRKQLQQQRDSGIPVATGDLSEDQDNYANSYY